MSNPSPEKAQPPSLDTQSKSQSTEDQAVRLKILELVLNAKVELPSRNPNDLLAYCQSAADYVFNAKATQYAPQRQHHGASPTGSVPVKSAHRSN